MPDVPEWFDLDRDEPKGWTGEPAEPLPGVTFSYGDSSDARVTLQITEPEDKHNPEPLDLTGAEAKIIGYAPYTGWGSHTFPAAMPSFFDMQKYLANEVARAAGLPAYLFTEPIVYRDPYPEESE